MLSWFYLIPYTTQLRTESQTTCSGIWFVDDLILSFGYDLSEDDLYK